MDKEEGSLHTPIAGCDHRQGEGLCRASSVTPRVRDVMRNAFFLFIKFNLRAKNISRLRGAT